MITDFYTPLFEATKSVFHLMLDVSDVHECSMDAFKYRDILNISIGVIGDYEGEIVYKFPQDMSLNMVNIMSGMEISSVDDFVTSAVSEIANIISGNVLTMLTEENVRCDILTPAVRDAEDTKKYALKNDFCISTSAGKVCLDIRLNPTK